jgi:hypothetical protein
MSKLASLAVVVGSVTLVWTGCSSDPAGTGASGATGGASATSDSTSNGSTSNGSTSTGSTSTGSASTGGTGGAPAAMPFFETDIVPIFTKSCGAGDTGCHHEVAYAATKAQDCRGWLALKDMPLGSQIYGGPMDGTPTGCPDLPLYERLIQLSAWQECGGKQKKYIVPCDVEASYVFDKIDTGPFCDSAPNVPSAKMPLGKEMDPNERETIRAWILAGAPTKSGKGVNCNGGSSTSSASSTGSGMMGQAPSAKINHPGDQEMRPANVAIPFVGVGTDPEDGTLSGASLVWTSNLTGLIGTGASFSAPLTAGTHVVTLKVTDSNMNTSTASLTLYIQ